MKNKGMNKTYNGWTPQTKCSDSESVGSFFAGTCVIEGGDDVEFHAGNNYVELVWYKITIVYYVAT